MENNLLNKVYTLINDIIHPHSSRDLKDKDLRQSKVCPVTGLDISMQARNSKFISATGVQWYFIHRKHIFEDKLLPYLTDYWKDQSMEKQFEEIAHNIRNQDSNKRHSTRRAINHLLSEKGFLFDPMQQIDESKLRQAGYSRK